MKRKALILLLCFFIALIGCVRIVSRFDYNGYLYAWNTAERRPDPADEAYSKNIYINFHWIFQNRFGRTGVIVNESQFQESFKNKFVARGTYAPVLHTHLSMLALREGMSIPEMVAAVGMPDELYQVGVQRLIYKMPFGGYYSIAIKNPTSGSDYNPHAAEVYSIGYFDAGGNNYYADDPVLSIQWVVCLGYLGVAAILSVVLVLLIKIPNAIRKRKALLQTD